MAERKYIKTKFEGVFYRISKKRDPETGAFDRVYCFWYADAEGKGHWKTVGRHSKGIRAPFARTERNKFLAEINKGANPAKNDKITVGEVVGAYIVWARNEGKQIDPQVNRYEKHLRKRLHMVPLAAVTPDMLSTIKSYLAATECDVSKPKNPPKGYIPPPPRMLSAQTIHHAFAFLRGAVYRAIATGMWSGNNPFAGRRGSAWQMPKVSNKNVRFLTPKEVKLLLSALEARSLQARDMAILSLKTGLRATEIFNLKCQDVDIASGILHVTSKGGKRDTVPLPKDVGDVLRDYLTSGGDYLFRNKAGGKMSGVSATFDRAVADLALNPQNGDRRYVVTFHTLRHTFASWLAQSGKVSIMELQKLMRHETITMTQRYAHLIPGQEHAKISIIDDVLQKEDDDD